MLIITPEHSCSHTLTQSGRDIHAHAPTQTLDTEALDTLDTLDTEADRQARGRGATDRETAARDSSDRPWSFDPDVCPGSSRTLMLSPLTALSALCVCVCVCVCVREREAGGTGISFDTHFLPPRETCYFCRATSVELLLSSYFCRATSVELLLSSYVCMPSNIQPLNQYRIAESVSESTLNDAALKDAREKDARTQERKTQDPTCGAEAERLKSQHSKARCLHFESNTNIQSPIDVSLNTE